MAIFSVCMAGMLAAMTGDKLDVVGKTFHTNPLVGRDSVMGQAPVGS
jgi:hypothetical protein